MQRQSSMIILSGAIVLSVVAPTIALPPNYSAVRATLQSRTSIPILLPTMLPASETYGDLDQATQQAYIVTLDYVPNCHGAAVCTLGRMSGTVRRGTPVKPKGKPMQLSGGITAYYVVNDTEENCNTGYCFSRLTWDYGHSRYSLKLKSSNPAESIKAANSAIRAFKTNHPSQH